MGTSSNSYEQNSLVLNPVENLPLTFGDESIDNLQGLYITDKSRNEEQKKNSKILFAGRENYIKNVLSVYEIWKKRLKAQDITMRPQSGLNAHLLMFLGLGEIGSKVMLLPEEAGGHFSTSKILKRIGYDVIHIPIDNDNKCIDTNKAIEVQKKEKCQFLFIDRSEGLIYEDFTDLCANFKGYKIFDASQYLTNIIFEQFKSPFEMGFDMIISTLHKNFPGPQKALICTNNSDSKEWKAVIETLYDCVSNIHADKILQAGVIINNPMLETYSNEILSNALFLEQMLIEHKIPVVTRNHSLVATHHLWLQFSNKEDAYTAYRRLEKNKILTNYRLLPYNLGYGLRLGTSCATIQGLTVDNIPQFVEYFSHALNEEGDTEIIQEYISKMIQQSKYGNY